VVNVVKIHRSVGWDMHPTYTELKPYVLSVELQSQ